MKFLSRHRLKSQRGGAVVEFALILPLLLLLLFGIIEFSLAMYDKHIITNASREGARFGIVARSPRHNGVEIRNVVTAWASQHLVTFSPDKLQANDDDIKVKYCPDPCTSWFDLPDNTTSTGINFGSKLKVTVKYKYDFFLVPNIPILGSKNNLPGIITLDAETVMNYE